jgi:hypothetical protein
VLRRSFCGWRTGARASEFACSVLDRCRYSPRVNGFRFSRRGEDQRAATRELLPNSIVERQKNPYPSTQDPAYEKALRVEVAEVLESRSHGKILAEQEGD